MNQIYSMKNLQKTSLKYEKKDYIIINFWASWCPPCIEETPSLIRFVEKYSNKFTLLALSQDSSRKNIEDFIRTFPLLKSNSISIVHDDSQRMAHSFGVEKLPETFIYSVKLKKYYNISGSTNWEAPELIPILNKYFNDNL